jgi:peptidoglycan/LPS O-acetylase OafA/YrhL
MIPYITAKKDPSVLFPTDGALWSLALEMLASLSFPLLLKLSDRQLRRFCVIWFGILIPAAFLHEFASYREPEHGI